MPKKISKEEWERRINEAGAGRYDFVRWFVNGEFGALKNAWLGALKMVLNGAPQLAISLVLEMDVLIAQETEGGLPMSE